MKVTKAVGLYTSDNPYETPEGSLATADNVVIRTKNIIEPRRGYAKPGYNFSSSTARAVSIGFFGSTPIVNTLDGSTYKLCYDDGSALTNYSGTYAPPSADTMRMKFAEAQQNFFFTTNAGVYKLDTDTSTPATAGLPRPCDPATQGGAADLRSGMVGNPAATGSWLAKDSAVAYKICFGRAQTDGVVNESAISGRYVVINPADATVSLTRNGANVVTATSSTVHGFKYNDTFTISPGGGTFGTGPFTVTSVPSSTTFTYTEVGAVAGPLASQTASSGTKLVAMVLYIPSGYVAGDILRVFRTAVVSGASIDPGEEFFLIHEGTLSATDISNGFYTYDPGSVSSSSFIDTTPDSLLGSVPAYTNPSSGAGIGESNFQPPLCNDVTLWSDRLWFGNTTSKHRYELRLIGVGTPDGIQNNDTLTLGDYTYRFRTTWAAAGDVPICSSLTPTQNVAVTAKTLAEVIEGTYRAGNTRWRAFYLSSENDAFGQLLIEEGSINGAPLYVGASRTSAWAPLPATSVTIAAGSLTRAGSTVTATTGSAHGFSTGQTVNLAANTVDNNYPEGTKTITVTGATTFTYTETGTAAASGQAYVVSAITSASTNDAAPNRLFYSKLQQPEAVPLLNYLDIGAKNHEILRILPLRDKLFVFKKDGIFTVSGEYPFRVDEFDKTVVLTAPDSAVTVANRVFALTNQGVVMVTDAGAAIISRPIEDKFIRLLKKTSGARPPFGVGYETEQQYLLWFPSLSNLTNYKCDQAYVYSIANNCWTRRTDSQQCGGVNPSTDYLYLGAPDDETLFKERKLFTRSDFADASYSITINAINSSTSVTLASTSSVSPGDYIEDGGGGTAVVVSVDSATALTVTSSSLAATGAATGIKSFQATVVYNPVFSGAPGVAKQIREVTLHFGNTPDYSLGYLTTTSEVSGATTSTLLDEADGSLEFLNQRKNVPRADQRAVFLKPGFKIREANATWKLYGFSLEGAAMSERNSR